MSSAAKGHPFSGERVIELASAINANLGVNLPEFTARDPVGFPVGYDKTFSDQLEKAKSVYSDDVMRSEQSSRTAIFDSLADKLEENHNELSRFVVRAFPDNKPVQSEFKVTGIKSLLPLRVEFVSFSRNLVKLIADNRAALETAGMSAGLSQSITDLAGKLDAARDDRHSAEFGRHGATSDRNNNHSNLWKLMKDIESEAEIIYANNPAKLAIFTLPKVPHTPKHSDDNNPAPENPVPPAA